jgi:hypothetical protein
MIEKVPQTLGLSAHFPQAKGMAILWHFAGIGASDQNFAISELKEDVV